MKMKKIVAMSKNKATMLVTGTILLPPVLLAGVAAGTAMAFALAVIAIWLTFTWDEGTMFTMTDEELAEMMEEEDEDS